MDGGTMRWAKLGEDIIRYFDMVCPYSYKKCRYVGNLQVEAEMTDGSTILYDHLDQSMRTLPDDMYSMSEEEFRRDFGRRLHHQMRNRGFNQTRLAERSGIHRYLINKYINGEVTPGFYAIDKIAKALSCSADEFRYIQRGE